MVVVALRMFLSCATVCYPSTVQSKYSNCTVNPSKYGKKIRGYTSIIIVKRA